MCRAQPSGRTAARRALTAARRAARPRLRLALVHPKASKELLADTLVALSAAPRPCQRVVSVDMYLIAAGSRREEAREGTIHVVRLDQTCTHIIHGATITQVDVDVVHGLVNARALAHRPGGSIRAEFAEEYLCGEFTVRRGRVYHRSAVQCDVLEVELGARDPSSVASAQAAVADFIAQALPAELFSVGAEQELATGGRSGANAYAGLAGAVHPQREAGQREGESTLFVQVARAFGGDTAESNGAKGAARGDLKATAGSRLPMS